MVRRKDSTYARIEMFYTQGIMPDAKRLNALELSATAVARADPNRRWTVAHEIGASIGTSGEGGTPPRSGPRQMPLFAGRARLIRAPHAVELARSPYERAALPYRPAHEFMIPADEGRRRAQAKARAVESTWSSCRPAGRRFRNGVGEPGRLGRQPHRTRSRSPPLGPAGA